MIFRGNFRGWKYYIKPIFNSKTFKPIYTSIKYFCTDILFFLNARKWLCSTDSLIGLNISFTLINSEDVLGNSIVFFSYYYFTNKISTSVLAPSLGQTPPLRCGALPYVWTCTRADFICGGCFLVLLFPLCSTLLVDININTCARQLEEHVTQWSDLKLAASTEVFIFVFNKGDK